MERLKEKGRLKEAKKIREKIIMKNHGLVYVLVLRKLREGYFYDLLQVGYLALIKAVDGYKWERGTEFSTYACKCIAREIRKYLDYVSSFPTISLDEYLDEEENFMLKDAIISKSPDPERIAIAKEMIDKMNAYLKKPPLEPKMIFAQYYRLTEDKSPVTLRTLGEKYGYSGEWIRRIRDQVKEELRKELELDEELQCGVFGP